METTATKIKCGVVGASGFVGSELIKLLHLHPKTELVYASTRSLAGKTIGEGHPHLEGLSQLVFKDHPSGKALNELNDLDCVFLALPHGESMEIVPAIKGKAKIVDLGADYRLKDAKVFADYYERPHTDSKALNDFVYGLSEINRNQIMEASRVANPGCFATAIELALYPLVLNDLLTGTIIADAKTGSTGSGIKLSQTNHHPIRAHSFLAYKMFNHQHTPEIVQTLQQASPGWNEKFIMQCHSAPMVRGIFASLYCTMKKGVTEAQVTKAFAKTYANCPFIRAKAGSPNVAWVTHSNFVNLGWAVDGSDLVLFSAIDNLMKGAASQAVQNMNLMFGWDETTGIHFSGGYP